jgi:hypothetical protein
MEGYNRRYRVLKGNLKIRDHSGDPGLDERIILT